MHGLIFGITGISLDCYTLQVINGNPALLKQLTTSSSTIKEEWGILLVPTIRAGELALNDLFKYQILPQDNQLQLNVGLQVWLALKELLSLLSI